MGKPYPGSLCDSRARLAMPYGYRIIAAEEVHIRMRAHDIALDLLQHLCILLHCMSTGQRCVFRHISSPAQSWTA